MRSYWPLHRDSTYRQHIYFSSNSPWGWSVCVPRPNKQHKAVCVIQCQITRIRINTPVSIVIANRHASKLTAPEDEEVAGMFLLYSWSHWYDVIDLWMITFRHELQTAIELSRRCSASSHSKGNRDNQLVKWESQYIPWQMDRLTDWT